MSISGLPPSGGANRVANAYGVPTRRPPAAPAASPAPAATEKAGEADKAGGAGAEGFKLRSVLNDEERAYFDQIAAMGPITYGPGSKGAGMVPEAPRGLRLDVRG